MAHLLLAARGAPAMGKYRRRNAMKRPVCRFDFQHRRKILYPVWDMVGGG